MPQAKSATREEIARFGHIAAALRAVMKQRDWGVPEFNAALGRARGDAGVYKWLAARGGPDPTSRAALERVTGIPAGDLRAREPGDPPPRPQAVEVMVPPAKISIPARGGDVLAFSVSSTGEARIRLDVSMPVAKAMPLLRMLLDAGLVLDREGE